MFKYFAVFLFLLILIGFLLPDKPLIPVQDAGQKDWHKETFWYEPWGSSGVHKGIDIFARHGTPVLAPTTLLILYHGEIMKGGKVIFALGPNWRLHYFAHLASFTTDLDAFVNKGEVLGTLGNTGNAKGKAPHLHYSLISVFPLVWRIDTSSQGYKKAFYLNPIDYLLTDIEN